MHCFSIVVLIIVFINTKIGFSLTNEQKKHQQIKILTLGADPDILLFSLDLQLIGHRNWNLCLESSLFTIQCEMDSYIKLDPGQGEGWTGRG